MITFNIKYSRNFYTKQKNMYIDKPKRYTRMYHYCFIDISGNILLQPIIKLPG